MKRKAEVDIASELSACFITLNVGVVCIETLTEVLSILAHDDAIWSVAWGTNKKENTETVVTGSLDDLVKVWKW